MAVTRLKLERDLLVLRDALGEAALHLEQTPDDPAAQQAVAELQRELSGAEQRLVQLDLADAARGRVNEARSRAAVDAEVSQLLERIENLHRSSSRRAIALVETIDDLGPQWAAVIADLSEARALAAQVCRLRGGSHALRLLGPDSAQDAVAAAVAAGIASSGIGVSGPSTSPWLTVVPPSNAFTRGDLAAELQRAHERRVEAMARAATFGRSEQEAAA